MGQTKDEMMYKITNYLDYLTDQDLKDISVQIYNIHKRRESVRIKQNLVNKERDDNG